MAVAPLGVHPLPLEVEMPPQAAGEGQGEQPPLPTWANGLPVAEGTLWGLGLRTMQMLCSATALAVLSRFSEVLVFGFLTGAVAAQCLCSMALAIVNVYALLVKRGLHSRKALYLFVFADTLFGVLITFFGVLITFTAASTSAGVTILMDQDLKACDKFNCAHFEAATAMGFIAWFCISPLLFLNMWSLLSSFF